MKDWQKKLEIAFRLAKTGFRLRVENSFLGAFWYLLNPLLTFALLIFVKQASFPEIKIEHYPLFLLIGISAFNFFKQNIGEAIEIISSNSELVKSINQVKAESLVVSVIIQNLFSHIFEFSLIIAASLFFGLSFWPLLLYPFLALIFSLLILGLAFIAATIGVYISDIRNIWAIAASLLFLGSPIFYQMAPGSILEIINRANPLRFFLDLARDLIISGNINFQTLIVFTLSSLVIFIIGLFILKRKEKKFAELL